MRRRRIASDIARVYVLVMAHKFTSVGFVLERLQECEHFLGRMAEASYNEFNFELNAFLSASRSVTFVLQRSLAHAPGFEAWYASQREQMKGDAAMTFFLELRNVSQKQGPVSYVAGGTLNGRTTYRFISAQSRVPVDLEGRDIGECCAAHLKKLAALVLTYYRKFPFNACIAQALTPKGMASLRFTLRDVEALLGLPQGYIEIGGDKFSVAEVLHVLRREVDAIDVADLERLAAGGFEVNGKPIVFPRGDGRDFTDDVAQIGRAHV